MKKGLKIVLIILLVLAAAVGVSAAVSRIVWHRSLMANVVELYLRIAWGNRDMPAEEAEAILDKKRAEGDAAYSAPGMFFMSNFEELEINGLDVLIFSGSDSPERTIIYIHGGAYVNEITRFHLRFCDKLAKKTNARVMVPIYPLAPNHTFTETYELVGWVYDKELKRGLPITLMGDSAGGGFAAAMAMDLAATGNPLPDSLVLISPWVDVSMSGDYGELAKVDPMLGVDRLTVFGKSWAGELDTKDPLISPLFGNAEGLPKTLIFTGTREIFYGDLEAFYEKLDSAGVDAKLVVGEGMDHVYPLYPIPEADRAMKEIVRFITE